MTKDKVFWKTRIYIHIHPIKSLNEKVGSLSNLGDVWKLIKIRKTERGNKEVFFKALRVWRRHNELPYENPLWLPISKDSKTGGIKRSLCNAAENTSIEKLAEMQSSRYWVE